MNISGRSGGQRIKSIQRGAFNTNSSASGNVVIAPVNLNRTEVRSKAALRGGAHGAMEVFTHAEAQAALLLRLASSSSLAWVNSSMRHNSSTSAAPQDLTVFWEVVEYE